MFDDRKLAGLRLLAKKVFAGSVFLLSVGNVLVAVAAAVSLFAGNLAGAFAAMSRLVSGSSLMVFTTPAVQFAEPQDIRVRRSSYGRPMLFLFALLLGAVSQAQAGEFCVANPQFNGVIDGTVTYIDPPLNTITQITIDGECTFKNFTAANPLDVTINFQTNDDSIYLITFDNVIFTGNMACAAIDHKLWVVNSPEGAFSSQCQDIIIPAETIAKQIPATTASIGVPFTYTLTLPSMEFPVGDPSPNDLGDIILTDDLNAMGVDISLVGIPAVNWESGGAVTHTFTNTGGLLTFDLPNILSGDQILIEITVVLGDTAANVAGTSFTNTAEWIFSRAIDLDENGIIEDGTVDLDGDGIIEDEFFDPLTGESGVSELMTIVEPDLVVTKSSTETALNLGILATFTIDVQNTGSSDAWDVTINDLLPDEATAGMCDYDPTTGAISAQVFEADGSTDVSGLLAPGSDYTVTYTAATCQLSFTMQAANAVIGSTQRLIITYQSELDADTTGGGVDLINVAGATQWFSGDSSLIGRRQYDQVLSIDGTPLVTDHEDGYTITTALSGYFFQKTVENLITGANPATTAAPGDTLRYQLRVFNVDESIDNITISDTLDPTLFDTALTSFSMVTLPVGATFSFNSGTGVLEITGFPGDLNLLPLLDPPDELVVEFEIDLASSGLNNGDVVPNQATLTANAPFPVITSDDPFVNGIAAPLDPTESTDVIIQTPGPLLKVNPAQTSATIGEQFTYTITVPAATVDVALYDVQILDDLIVTGADMSFVSASVVSGGSWTLSNTGTDTALVIEDTVTGGIDIPANGQAVIEITVELLNTVDNNDGDLFNNSATYLYNRSNGDITTLTAGESSTTTNMTVVEPDLPTVSKVGTLITAAPVSGGSIIEYVITMTNGGTATAYDINIVDTLPAELALYDNFTPTATIGATPVATPVAGFNPAPTDAPAGPLIWGDGNGDGSLDIPVGETLILTYQAQVQVSTEATFNNTVSVDWTSLDGGSTAERTGSSCPTITAPNDYCVTATGNSFSATDNNSLTKAVTADSWITDGSTAIDATVRIGDTVTYQLTLNLGEGATNSVMISDVLPTGMAFVSLVSITPASVAVPGPGDFSYTVVSQPALGDTTLTWDFGNIINTPSNDATPTDALVIEYTAAVLPDAGIAQIASTVLTNTATLAYQGSGLVADPSVLVDTAIITLLQPVMTPVTKVERTGLIGTAATPLNVNVATDIMQFRLESCNSTGLSGQAPAYSVLLSDVLATQLDETSMTVPVVSIDGTALSLLAGDYTYINPLPLASGGTLGIQLNIPVDPGQCVTVDYDIGFRTDLGPNEVWNNSVTLDEYWSLPVSSGQLYGPVGPAQFFMTNEVVVEPLTKVVASPLSGEVTIGEEAVYTITVPGNPVNAVLNNVVVTDTLHAALEYTGVTAVDGGGLPVILTDNSVGPGAVSLSIAQIPAGEQVIITLSTRVVNNADANAGTSFTNTADYTYTGKPATDVTEGTSGALLIVEPLVAIAKTVAPLTPPNAGDILTYSLTFNASGGALGDNFSDAFDLSIDDSLSLGLTYVPGTATVDGAGNTIADPITNGGDGITTAQVLNWNLAGATADIDIVEGTIVTVTYDVVVLDTVLAGQNLTNSASAQWTGLDTINPLERTGSGAPVENDYFTGQVFTTLATLDNTTLTKTRLSDTWDATTNVRIGDLIDYELRIHLDEGSHSGLVLSDELPQGLQFEQVVSINGDAAAAPYSAVAPFTHSDIATPATSGDAATGPTTVTWTLGDVVNVGDNDATNDDFVIIYRARVLNLVFGQNNSTTLTNTATLNYTVATGPASQIDTEGLTLLQPNLTVSKTVVAAGGDTVINAGELITYTVDIINNGLAPAYDTELEDIIPVGLRQGGVTTTSITIAGVPVLPILNPTYVLATGITTWNFDSGGADTYTIPAGQTLQIVYTVLADADLGPGLTMTNAATATVYYSFDDEVVPTIATLSGVREIYAPSNTATTTLTSPLPGAPLKQNPVTTTATIGEEFTYTITVPETPLATALHDVRILDNLGLITADLTLVSISKISPGGTWVPVNNGTATNLIIEDITNGIEIPANDQIVIGVTVRLDNSVTNIAGLAFSNSASYTYNQVDGDNLTQLAGGSSATTDMTVVEPDLAVTKVGTLITAAPVSGGSIIEYVISMTNGGTAIAYDVNIVDSLPAELALYSGFVPTATIGGVPVGGFVTAPAGAPAGPLIWGLGNGDGSLDIPVGGTLILTYQAQVQVSTAATFNNTVSVDWTSLEGGSAFERTGAGCAAPDDYCVTVTGNSFTITDSNSLTKAVIADSYVDAPSTALDATVRIGDTATYQLTINLGESTTNSVTVSDVLPTGMVIDSFSITPASGGTFTYTVTNPPVAGDPGPLVWDLGNIINTPSNDNTPIDTLVIEYTATVLPDAGVAQAPTTTLINTATLGYLDGSGTPVVDSTRLVDTADITLWQPVMSAVTKVERTGLVGTAATPLNVTVATDTMLFRLESCNTTGLAPAYSVLLTDVLATQLDETSMTVPVVSIDGTALPATAYVYTDPLPLANGGTLQIELITPVNPGQCVTVDYDIGFHTDFGPNQVWNNSVTLDEYWSLPASSGQLYGPLGPAQFFMTNQVIVQPLTKVVASPAGTEVTIGDEVVYTITVPGVAMNTVLNNVVVTDTLHAALEYISASAVDGGGLPVALTESVVGQDVGLSIAQIPAGEQVIITINTRVANDTAANAGVSFTNTAAYTYDGMPVAVTDGVSGPLLIVEPTVAIAKTVAPLTPPNAGDILTYSLTFTASGGVNFSDAFDLSINDSLSLGLSYVPGTATVDGAGNTIADPTTNGGDGITTAQILSWNLADATADIDIVEGTIVTVSYNVVVLASVQAGQVLNNSATAQWTGLDTINPLERTGTGAPVENDYFTGPVSTTLITQSGALLKTTTQVNATIGEQFTYRITVPAIAQSTDLNDVRILDDLNISSAADMTFVSVTKITGSQPWTPVNTGDAKNLVIEDTAIGIDIPAGEQAVIEITVELDDSATNTSGLVFNNTADYTYNVTQDPGLPGTSGDTTIIGADFVTLEKSGPATMRVGLPGTFTINVQNTGTAPAWDLTITDKLPNPVPGGMCDTAPSNITAQIFQADGTTPVSAVLTQGAGADYITSFSGEPACTLTITMQSAAAAIAPNDRLIVSYESSIDLDNISATTLTNVAAATEWFGGDTAGAGATGAIHTYTGILSDGTVATLDEQDAHNLIVESPVLVFQKSVVNVTTGQDPGADAQPGDTLRYTLYVGNISPVTVPDFSLVDELDALNASALFVPGSLTIVSVPAGADFSNTDPNGGTNGTGLLDIRDLSLDIQGGANDRLEIVFEVTLVPVIDSGTVVLNQTSLVTYGVTIGNSDDPNVNGLDDPTVAGDENPTETLITSAPVFQVEKISTDITGDPVILEAGDTLRYSITVKNIGLENSVNTLLSDQIPANTTYVANSTTLNGVAVADPGAGISTLAAGLLINAPENTSAGFMRADTDPVANNLATITFDVVINDSVIDGAVISNQGFVSGDGAGTSGAFPVQPSDDPGTPLLPDDPTLDVVGSVPVVDVLKTVVIQIDNGTVGIVDPGDTLRYTITTTNIGVIPATNVVLVDDVPLNTTYVADSVFLNGLPVAQPDGGVSPLIAPAGIAISSSDLTPPLPISGNGTLSPGESAVVIFDVTVNAVAPGTIISNQGFVSNNETPTEPTDSDGNDGNGDQPTVVVVGNVQQLAITKQVFVVGSSVAEAGGQLEYVVRVTNIGGIDATNVVINDNLDLPVAGQMTYIDGSGLLNGLATGVSFSDPVLSANYSATYGDLVPGGVAELRFRVLLDATLALGTTITNIGEVSWNTPPATVSASVDIDVGGTPGSANLNGQVWHDTDFSNDVGASEILLQNWTVELYRNNVLLANTQTDVNGVFQFSGMLPNLPAGNAYELRYIAPGAVANSATLGTASSVFINGAQRISDIFAASGSSLQNLDLPRQPNGIVYDSVLRVPVAGAQLSMINQTRSNQLVPASCFEDPNHQNQVTPVEGFYKFDLNFSDPTRCAEGDEYEIQVQPPANGYVGTTSAIIPPVEPVTGTAQDVPNCPGSPADQVSATAQHCENSVSAVQPDMTIAPRTSATNYYMKFLFNGVPSTDQIFNNHIPIDPELDGAVSISKVAGLQNVTRSQLVPYTITLNNTLGVPLQDLNVVDNFPAGFKYITGSSRVDGVELEPLVNGGQLTWPMDILGVSETRTIKLLLVVGSGVGEGEYVNTAHVINSLTGGAASGVASATVQVIPDPTFDCADIIGKVFDDKNKNTYQDEGETGLPGVQVATARGLRVTTDQHGRFHITCAVVPNEVRGSNFIMKLDDRTLPSGYRITTENPRVLRATRGKMLKFNFGASIHRVVRLDLADGVFEKGSTMLRPQWRSRIDLLLIELQKDTSILRLSYLGENETESEVENRLDAIEELISDRWRQIDCCYKLTIEKEVFWRKGNPSDRTGFE